MIDFNCISTLLFDIDNTLLLFDEQEFIPIYIKNIHTFFEKYIPDVNTFGKIFLRSTHKMVEKKPFGFTNMDKFFIDFTENFTTLKDSEIKNKFYNFYMTKFDNLKSIIKPNPIVKPLLSLAEAHFKLIAATNPLFPAIANKKRLQWGGIGPNDIRWLDITSADDYHYTKPHLEYYQEILNRNSLKASECLIIGNDNINDMIAGKLGIKTFLIEGQSKIKIIKTELDHQNLNFPVDSSGSLKKFLEIMKIYILSK